VRLDLSQPIHLDVEAAEGDAPRRLISGVAVPYGQNANASTGPVRPLHRRPRPEADPRPQPDPADRDRPLKDRYRGRDALRRPDLGDRGR
jgi:hypothetical protein